MLDIDALSPSQATADQCGGSGYQVFDGDHIELACLIVQLDSPRQRAPERVKQVDAKGARLVDQLQQRPAGDSIRVNVVLEKRLGKRSWNRREVLHNEVDVVHGSWFDGSPVYSKLCVDGQTACQRTSKAMSEHCRHNFNGFVRIIMMQQRREHTS
jgi:hypothetical protein